MSIGFARRRTAPLLLLAAALAGCTSSTEPEKARVAPVAVASIEVLRDESAPDPTVDASCQTGGVVLLKAIGSHDPAGRTLTYEWHDAVMGSSTADFYPLANPHRTSEPEFAVYLFTVGYHDIVLTVTASDGRKARKTLRVKVTACEC